MSRLPPTQGGDDHDDEFGSDGPSRIGLVLMIISAVLVITIGYGIWRLL